VGKLGCRDIWHFHCLDFSRLLWPTSNLQAQLHDDGAYLVLVAAIAPAHTHTTPCRSQPNTPQRPSLSPRARRSARPSDPPCRPKPSTQTTRYFYPPTIQCACPFNLTNTYSSSSKSSSTQTLTSSAYSATPDPQTMPPAPSSVPAVPPPCSGGSASRPQK
jgi:hypothetical protein